MMDFLILKAYAGSLPGSETGAGSLPGAEGTGGINFSSLFNKIITNIAQPIASLLLALAVVYFVWGVMVFIKNADNPEKRKEGYEHMIWGIIGIFIMVSATGIVRILQSTIGVN